MREEPAHLCKDDFTKLLKKNPDWVWTTREVIPTAKGFVLKWIATIPVQSYSATIEGLDILELREDKITRNEVYFDRSALLKSYRDPSFLGASPIDLCINNAIISVQEQNTYAQTEG